MEDSKDRVTYAHEKNIIIKKAIDCYNSSLKFKTVRLKRL